MSRSERRAYQRLTKNQDPFAPPAATAAARARMERQRTRRGAGARSEPSGRLIGGRTGLVVFGGGAAAFMLGLSVAWPNGAGIALLIGIAAGVAWIAATIGFVLWRRRVAGRRAGGRNPAGR